MLLIDPKILTYIHCCTTSLNNSNPTHSVLEVSDGESPWQQPLLEIRFIILLLVNHLTKTIHYQHPFSWISKDIVNLQDKCCKSAKVDSKYTFLRLAGSNLISLNCLIKLLTTILYKLCQHFCARMSTLQANILLKGVMPRYCYCTDCFLWL